MIASFYGDPAPPGGAQGVVTSKARLFSLSIHILNSGKRRAGGLRRVEWSCRGEVRPANSHKDIVVPTSNPHLNPTRSSERSDPCQNHRASPRQQQDRCYFRKN